MSFTQGIPSVPTLFNMSNCFVYGNSSSGNAFTVQQLGAGNVAVFSNSTGTGLMVINSLGQVGIRTTNPATALDVYTGTMNAATVAASTQFSGPGTGLTGTAASLNVGGTSGGLSGTPNITVGTVSGTTLTASSAFNASGTATYQVAGTTVIDASRNLTNIGTVSGTTITASSQFSGPGTGLTGTAASLNVGGSAGSLSTTYTAGRILYGAGSGVPTTTSTLFYDSANGRLGIGTVSPSYTLDCATGTVQANQLRSTAGNYLTLVNGAGGSQLQLQGSTTAITGGTVYMTGGNVGIGTTNPQNTLHVQTSGNSGGIYVRGDNNTALQLTANNTGALGVGVTRQGQISIKAADTTDKALQFYNSSSDVGGSDRIFRFLNVSAIDTLSILNNGNVGIGTTSVRISPKFWSANDVTLGNPYAGDVACQIAAVGSTNPDKRLALMYDTTNNIGLIQAQIYGTGPSSLCLNAADGNVGIGMTNPSYKLHLVADSAAKPNGGSWTNSSDQRLKEDIVLANLDTCYTTVKNLPLKYWKWRDDIETFSPSKLPDRHKLGWIAQDVLTAIPKAVVTANSYGYDDCLWLNPDQIYATLYGALQKTMADKEDLETRVSSLEARLALLEQSLESKRPA